jgi:hypothetical protein
VSFAGTAAVVQAPTLSRDDIVAAIDRFQLQRGTAIGSGIVLSLATIFPEAGIDLSQITGQRNMPPAPGDKPKPEFTPVEPGSYSSAAIILLTDGQRTTGPDPLEAAKMAADRGVRIYTVGIGTKEGETIGFEGWSMRVRLDEPTLKNIASITRADYFYAGTAADLKKVYQGLSTRLVVEKKEPKSARCSPPWVRCWWWWPRACRCGGSAGWREPPQRSACATAQRRRLNLAPSLHNFAGASVRREPPQRSACATAQRWRLNLAPSLHNFAGASLRRERALQQTRRQICTRVPSSTTALSGRRKNSATPLAFRLIVANRRSRQ